MSSQSFPLGKWCDTNKLNNTPRCWLRTLDEDGLTYRYFPPARTRTGPLPIRKTRKRRPQNISWVINPTYSQLRGPPGLPGLRDWSHSFDASYRPSWDAQHRTSLARTCLPLEECVARGHLRVRGILDLAPVRARAVRMVATARELGHDARQVVRSALKLTAPQAESS
jgi:hypothetical protein